MLRVAPSDSVLLVFGKQFLYKVPLRIIDEGPLRLRHHACIILAPDRTVMPDPGATHDRWQRRCPPTGIAVIPISYRLVGTRYRPYAQR